ncbi:hypothetical protein SESBI_47706 [Sesbania bispinosa]|nr:hypothetical protein SESBI_47706 [Sesbania bispinosa]
MAEEVEGTALSKEEVDNLIRSTKKQKHGDMFPTATSMKLQRGIISYKDICMGSSPENESENNEDDDISSSSSDSEDDDSDLQEFLSECDPLCPIVKISKKEKNVSVFLGSELSLLNYWVRGLA